MKLSEQPLFHEKLCATNDLDQFLKYLAEKFDNLKFSRHKQSCNY